MDIKKVAILGAGAVGSYVVWGLSKRDGISLGVVAEGERAERLKKGCIINDPKCRPRISSQVRSVNYITVPVAEGLDGRNIKHGTKVRIDITNHSVDQLVVTNTEITTSSLQGNWTKTAKNMKLNGYSNSKDFSVAAIQQLYDETKRLERQKRDK